MATAPSRPSKLLIVTIGRTETQTFCRNEYNLTGLCSRHSCPLANARYATVREQQGNCYLYLKTIERAHLPAQMWEKIKLPKNYTQALALIDEHTEFWAKFQRHKCKQRLTKLHQMLVRKRKLKVSALHNQEKFEVINKREEKRDRAREGKALIAAKLETAIEKELLQRLKAGTYNEIYNLEEGEFNKALDEEEVEQQDYQGEYGSEDGPSDLGSFSDEMEEYGEEELDEAELESLEEEMRQENAQIEAAPQTGKRPRDKKAISLEYEYEEETGPKKKVAAEERVGNKRRAVSKSTAGSSDF